MEEKNIGLILVHIEEAHTIKWPLGLSDHPTNHTGFADRIERAQQFVHNYPQLNQFNNVYIDTWSNDFEQTYQSWPDKFYLIDQDLKVLDKSEYSSNAKIITDYSEIISKLIGISDEN